MNLRDRVGASAERGRNPNPNPSDRRGKERKRQRLIDGFVASARFRPPCPCRICDMSPSGSRIELWGAHVQILLPGDRITLYIPTDRKEIDAEVRWRKDSTFGLQFKSAFRAPSRPYG